MQQQTENNGNNAYHVLIIDKKGLIGTVITGKLKEHLLVVLVSGKELEIHKNIIHIPYHKKIPLIPDNTYSHIFIVYNGEEEVLDMLPSFVKKANEANSRLFFITSHSHWNENLHKTFSHHAYHGMQIIVYGQVYDEELAEENELTYFIYQARETGRVEVPNDGLALCYPIYWEDMLQAIITLGFSFEKKNQIHYLFPRSALTQLAFVHSLQRIDPLLKIDFKHIKHYNPHFYLPPEGEFYFHTYDIEHSLKKITIIKKKVYTPSPNKKIIIHRSKKRGKISSFISTAVFVLVLVPLFMVFISSISGALAMQASLRDVEHGKLSSAKNIAVFAKDSFAVAHTITQPYILFDVILRNQREALLNKLQAGIDTAQVEIDLLNAASTVKTIYYGKSVDPVYDFGHVITTVKNSLLMLQKMKAEKQLPSSISHKLDELHDPLTLVENTIDIYPSLFGFEGKKKYLVLFQNNMEIRPGGGFIGSFGILEVQNGRIDNFKIYDVYDADGKLSIQKEPPYSLRRYLGVTHWFLRDSNMFVDFPKNAQEAMGFLALETGEKVDGVVAVDTDFLKNMISVFGSVSVPDYNEEVRSENFYMITQTYAEKDFHPGSTQKKDFLRSLSNAMLMNLTEMKNIKWTDLVTKASASVKEKHVLFSSVDPAIQKIFTVNNVSSTLWDDRKPGDNLFLDYFGVIDANVGANKVNYYIKRSINQQVDIGGSGNIHSTAVVTYDNTSAKNSPFGGDYKNYVTFVLPNQASLDRVKIGDQLMPLTAAVTDPAVYSQSDFTPPSELEVEQQIQNGKKLISFLFLVPAGSTKKISVTYTINNAVDTNMTLFTHSLHVFKQPGTRNDTYNLVISYPNTYTLLESSDGIADVGSKLFYEQNLNEDFDVSAKFVKK